MTSLKAQRIAVIGAGPSGLVAAKYLRAEKFFQKIVVFEQRSRPGGIWNYTHDDRNEDIFTVPQTDPNGKNQDPTWREPSERVHDLKRDGATEKEASFLSPVYEKLETNIPRGLMGFHDLDWPQDAQLFPKHETVLEYIKEYGKDVQDLVKYETQVIDVVAADEEYCGKWRVRTRDLRSNMESEDTFDAVIVANGHFIVPYVPDIPGIREWNASHPGAISHSKYFRRAEDFAEKKVIVVGNSASGIDISSQIAAVAHQPLLWSSRSPCKSAFADARKREYPPIAKFLPDSRGVEFENGVVEENVDAIVFATGYFYSLPFLRNIKPELIGDGTRVQHTYQHLFYAPRPTLSFLVLNQRIIPFPLAEAQSAVLARVYSGRLPLPHLAEMKAWEEKAILENGSGRTFHLLPFPRDAHYINEMSAWAMTAQRREGLENDGKGKIPPVWGKWEIWCREHFLAIRAAFGAKGEARFGIRTPEELGFCFEEHSDKEPEPEPEEEEKII